MEITDIDTYVVDIPLVALEDGGIGPYVTNHNELSSVERVLVRVDTDEGISGWGEVRVFLSAAATVSIIEDGIAPMVVGQSPFEVEKFRRQLFIEYGGIEALVAPVEIACWDIVGKELDKPIYELLGGWTAPDSSSQKHRLNQDAYAESDSIEFAYCLGILSPEKSHQYAERVREAGYNILKTKAGRDWRVDVERIKAMHDAVDGELEFRLDPNQGWTLDEAIRVAAELDDAGIRLQYLEQPIRVDAHDSLARLRERTYQPIAPNEDTYINHNLRRLIHHGAADVAVLDMTPAGGIAGVRQLASVAEAAAVPATHHCAFDLGIRTAAILHAVYGIPGFTLPPDTTYYSWETDVITDPFTISAGCITVPTDPGLGIEVDMDTVAEYSVE
jgi:L-alanine-DL-glutamate epimerase-like enolase superfamily enzyme